MMIVGVGGGCCLIGVIIFGTGVGCDYLNGNDKKTPTTKQHRTPTNTSTTTTNVLSERQRGQC
jgi:hypothetical protein